MNVLSLLDGISCGRVALERVGISVEKYYASEIDKWAIQVTKKNYPDTIHVGDVKEVSGKDFDGVSLLIGGSPCQGFSYSGKKLNFQDPRSLLFFEFVRILKEVKPRYFLLENVKMKKESQDIISSYLGVEPIEINSALVSAQSRRRLYWTNIPNVTIPDDKKIPLSDILEQNPVNPVVMSEKTIERFKKYGVPLMDGTEPKARCLSAMEYVKNGKQGNYLKFIAGIERGRRLEDGKSLSRNFSEGYRIYDVEGKSATLTARTKGGEGGYTGLYGTESEGVVRYRKLTPIECERLQTLPDNYTEGLSNTQRYKTIGNGWTVDVISHILKGIE